MKSQVGIAGLYAGSVVAHAVLWVAVVRVKPEQSEPPPPVRITIRDVEAPKPPPPPPPPKPEPPAADDEVETAAPVTPPPVAPKPAAPQPKASPPPKATAPEQPAAESSPPALGLELGNSNGPGGLSVAAGDPSGVPGGTGKGSTKPAKAMSQPKVLSAAKETADACEEDDVKPTAIELPTPEYSQSARAEGIAGKVRVKVTIDETGAPVDVAVVESLHPELDLAAVEAVKAAKFTPGTRCGKAQRMTIKVSIRFSL